MDFSGFLFEFDTNLIGPISGGTHSQIGIVNLPLAGPKYYPS